MDLKKFFSSGLREWEGYYSDKRTSKTKTSGKTEIIHEGDQIKAIITYNLEDDLYPKEQTFTKPKSIIDSGILSIKEDNPEYGKIKTDQLLVGDKLIHHFHSANGQYRGSSVVQQISENEFVETGFAYNAEDDILRWEKTIRLIN